MLLTWLYLSSYILLFGAELNSELEHQTTADTTAGADQPLGSRGAWAADHVAEGDAAGDQEVKAKPQPTAPDRPSGAADYFAGRATSRLGHVVGLKKVGMLSSGVATVGLSLLRKPGRALPGLAALAGAATLAWLGREPEARPTVRPGAAPR